MKVAVTGASGFIGGHVVRKALALGWEVHSFGRKSVKGTVFHQWDALKDNEENTVSFDAVIHCAAAAKDWGDDDHISKVNMQGTVKALEIDREAKFIHVSTASVYASKHNQYGIDETTELNPRKFLNAYTKSKWLAELLVEQDGRIKPVYILRPHAVYGRGDTTLLPRLEQRIKDGRIILPRGGNSVISLTHVENLVDVIADLVTLDAQRQDECIYNVADRDPMMLKDILSQIMSERGVDLKIHCVYSGFAYVLGSISEKVFKILKVSSPPVITRYVVAQLGYHEIMKVDRIENLLGRRLPSSDFSSAKTW